MSHACHHHHIQHHEEGPAAEHLATDPVCGMKVDPHATQHRAEHEGRPYYFCSAGCRGKFRADPGRYLNKAAGAPEPPPPPGAIYTCPMHPDVRQVGPGSCPICGMALEPETITADAGPNHELIDMTRRFWTGAALALPLLLGEMGGHLFGLRLPVSDQTWNWIQLALATPVVLWAGAPFFARGWASLKNRNLNMFTLIAVLQRGVS